MAELIVPSVDFSSLGQLPQVIQQNRQNALRQQTLANLGQGGTADAAALLRSGDLSLAQLGLQLQTQERQAARDKVLDSRADREFAANQAYRNSQLALSRENQDYTPEERAKIAGQYGIQPGTQEFKQFVLTGALPAENTTVNSQVEQRKTAAASIGLTPEHPAYQGFILTGKMPREDAQPLTATDKKAILEADEGVLTNKAVLTALDEAMKISPQAHTGFGASARATLANNLPDMLVPDRIASKDSAAATSNYENIVLGQALSQLKSTFGAAPTEGERKILLELQASVNKPDNVRQDILKRARAMAENRLKFNEQRAAELRGGQFYKPQGSMTRAPVTQKQGITQEQYNALPSGSKFIDPEGNERVKP